MTSLIRRFLNDEAGAAAIEYALIVAMISLAIVGSVSLFASNATAMFDRISAAVGDAIG